MNRTPEQQTIVSHVESTEGLTLVDSIAGSGKTTLLVGISTSIPHTNGLYLAYNRSVATEAARKFPKTTHCLTTHAMAYQAVVKRYKLTLGTFGYKNITESVAYEQKCLVSDHMRSFCLSSYTTFTEYAKVNELAAITVTLSSKYLGLMQTGAIECTHEFYLKYFHVLLADGTLTYDPFDFIMLDEAGDLNEVTLAIFLLLPSPRKIAVGDKHQNIYQFNETINCFNVLHGQGTLLKMTQSFRVSSHIATKIEAFCHSYLDPNMQFRGVPLTDKSIRTRAFLTRTNGALIARMIVLNEKSIPYGLLRRPQEIFKVPLMLCSLKYQGFITDPAYKFIQADIDEWYESQTLKENYKNVLSYLAFLYSKDVQLTQAIRLLQRYGKATIIDTYEEARKHTKADQSYILATCHSCKGAEFDEVTIADDLNDTADEAVSKLSAGYSLDELTQAERESLNLYYVAVTRAAKELYNAKHL